MTFPEIFDKFKKNDYVRRECWSKNTFIQLRRTTPLIRLIMFATADTPNMKAVTTLQNDVRLSAEDLLADDWEYESLND